MINPRSIPAFALILLCATGAALIGRPAGPDGQAGAAARRPISPTWESLSRNPYAAVAARREVRHLHPLGRLRRTGGRAERHLVFSSYLHEPELSGAGLPRSHIRTAREIRLQRLYPDVHRGQVQPRRVGGPLPPGGRPLRRPRGRAPRRLLDVGHGVFGVERGQDGPQAGHRRRTVGGHQEGRIEVRHRLPPRRELVLLPGLGQALRLRRSALFRPLRSDP